MTQLTTEGLGRIVEAVAIASHNYFRRRKQTKPSWAELPPTYRVAAMESHLEILREASPVIEQMLAEAAADGPVLRLRLEMFIAELRQRAGTSAGLFADELQALIDQKD